MTSSASPAFMAQRTASTTSLALRGASCVTKPWKLGLETRNVRERELTLMHVQPAQLRAAMQDGKHLSRVQQPRRIERAFQPLLMREVAFAELLAHEVTLLDTHAVL